MEKNRLYIVGSTTLCSELISHVVEEIGIPCAAVDELQDISPNEHENNEEEKLVLIDAIENNLYDILSCLNSQRGKDSTEQILALFNLEHNKGVENEGIMYGVRGFFYKEDCLELFLKGIQTLLAGEPWLSRDILVQLAMQGGKVTISEGQEKAGLTHREMEILSLVSTGSKNDTIAEELFISPHTVKTHLYHLFRKIGVNNRFQASLWASSNL